MHTHWYVFDRNINGNRDDKFLEWDYWSLHWWKKLTLIILCTCSVTGPQFTVQVHLIKREVESSFQLWKLFQEQDNSKVWVKLKWFLALLMVSRKIKGGNQKRAVVAAAEIFQILVRINEFQKYIIEFCRIWFIIVWKGQWIKKPVGLFACRFFHFSTVFNETFSIKRPSSQ